MSTHRSLASRSGTQATPRSARRPATLTLELQAPAKFALAIIAGLAAVFSGLPAAGAAAIIVVAIIVAGRALGVMGLQPEGSRSFRPTSEALWDGALAAGWALTALGLAADGSLAGTLIAGIAAVALAALRLRTRYVL